MSNSLNYTYLFFNVIDYTNSDVLSTFTLGNTPLTFKPDFSTSSILSGAQSISNKTLRWDFGDGTYSTDLIPRHNYQWPGEYNVTLTIFDSNGNAYDSTFRPTVQVYDFISTQIVFEEYKSLIYDIPVGRLIDPLTINAYFSWQNYSALSATGYTINLYASGAKGAYNYVASSLQDKWSHLRALSRFYTLSSINGNTDYVTVESIQPNTTPVYVNIQNNQLQLCQASDPGSVLAGVTGSGQFWYTDDSPANLLTENPPIIIFATIDNTKFNDAFTQRTSAFNYINYPAHGLQNINPVVFADIKTRYNPADHLSITTTGIDGEGNPVDTSFDIPYISWQNTEIPYLIKFKDIDNFTTKNYPPLSSSIAQNTTITPQQFYDVQTGVMYSTGSGTYIPLDGVTFYEDFPADAPQSIGAFYKGYFIATQSTENCILTASVNVIDPPYYTKDALAGWIAIPQYNSAFRIIRQEQINGYDNTTTLTFTDNGNDLFNTGNNSNLYAITMAPSGTSANSDYQTWFADAVNNTIVKYDIYGNQLPVSGSNVFKFTLSAMPTRINNQITVVNYNSTANNGTSGYATPNDIALDGNSNIWVSLIDSGSAIKIDTANGYVTTVAAPISSARVPLNFSYTLSGFEGENLFVPVSLDADLDNNIWIAYSHPDFSYIIKYKGTDNSTTAATLITAIPFPSGITPEQIQIDRNGYIWATAINHNSSGVGFNNRDDYLFKFDSNGNLYPGYPLHGFKQIGNLAIDGNQNAWVIQGAETLTKIDGVTNQTTNYAAGLGKNNTEYICSIGGLTCDTSNNLWVINNFDKNLYIIDASLPAPTSTLFTPKYIIPLTYPSTNLPVLTSYDTAFGSTTAINTTTYTPVHGQYSDGLQEFQAIGDWNGYNWLNKYAAPVSTIRTITGSSSLFNIYPDQGQFNIAKVNENWNASGFYDSLRYQETLIDKQIFFDQFLGVIVGGVDAQPYELGKTVYEKIANFIDNNADIDKVNINELISFCSELSIEYNAYNLTLPPQIRRLVDLLSIKQSVLWGNTSKYTQNFNPQGTLVANDNYGTNLGTAIDPLTGTFINGIPIVAQETFSGNYSLVNTNILADYPIGAPVALSAFTPNWGWGLVLYENITGLNINNFYNFYTYNPMYDNTYYDNIINWNDPYTTLSPINSTYSAWSSNNGIVQSLFSYELTKGFRLFTSAADITYNS